MASEEDRLLEDELEDVETSSEISIASISAGVENGHNNIQASETNSSSRFSTRSSSQGFIPVEVSRPSCQNVILLTLQLATFPTLDFDTGFEMSRALERCKKRVLNPYHYFLKTVRISH